MLNVSHSVALDYYSEQSDILLEGTNHQIQFLENQGKLDISGNNLRRYIGRTLNLKKPCLLWPQPVTRLQKKGYKEFLGTPLI